MSQIVATVVAIERLATVVPRVNQSLLLEGGTLGRSSRRLGETILVKEVGVVERPMEARPAEADITKPSGINYASDKS
jgi:hypothetical protein